MPIRGQDERGGAVVATRFVDAARAEHEPAVFEAPVWGVGEKTGRARSPFGTSTVCDKRSSRKSKGIGDGEASVREVSRGHVVLECFHMPTRRTHAVAGEERTRVEWLDVDVPRGVRVDLGKKRLGENEQLFVLRADLAIGAIMEVWEQLLDHAEQVLHGEFEWFPSLRGLTHALENSLELRENEESGIGVLRKHELALVLGHLVVASGHFARDATVEAINQRFDMAEVQPTEMRFEDICTIDGGLRCPCR